MDRLAQRRIQQILEHEGQKIEKIAPKIIRGAIEDVYWTPFRLLGNFGEKKSNQLKQKINKGLRYVKRYV